MNDHDSIKRPEMEEKSNSALRRYHLIHPRPSDQQDRTNPADFQRLIPLTMDHLPSSAGLQNKRRRCSITTESSLSTPISSHDPDLIFDRSLPATAAVATPSGASKRSAQDDTAAYSTPHFLRDQDHYSNKRARYEHSRSIELENQPPRPSLMPRSLFLNHQQESNRFSSTWSNLAMPSEMPLFFPDVHSRFSRTTTVAATASATPYQQTLSVPNHEHDCLSDHYSSMLAEHHHQHHHHHRSSSMFLNDSPRVSGQKSTNSKIMKDQMCLLSSQSNGNCPLRTTNFLLDNKQEQQQQQTILRTGNVSPAHSDSSSESTSTCSSDEHSHQHFTSFRSHHHPHHHHHQQQQQQQLFPQAQPWRTYRERENYEQLLDLAEKLSDPNRFKQVDVQQFFSYRYKTIPITSEAPSKQTACVICMSHFKNGQHIRVLPCQHEYHSKCIARWFTMNSSCPICRRDNFLSPCL